MTIKSFLKMAWQKVINDEELKEKIINDIMADEKYKKSEKEIIEIFFDILSKKQEKRVWRIA